MIPTLALTSITQKWVQALRNSKAINDFCTAKYGRRPTIYMGINGTEPPIILDCPLIIVFPGSKAEGLHEAEYQYTISVSWAIVNEQENTNNDIVEHLGIVETDTLGQLIYQTIAELNPSCPVSHVDYNIEVNDFFPQYPGRMDIVLTVPVSMGAALVY